MRFSVDFCQEIRQQNPQDPGGPVGEQSTISLFCEPTQSSCTYRRVATDSTLRLVVLHIQLPVTNP